MPALSAGLKLKLAIYGGGGLIDAVFNRIFSLANGYLRLALRFLRSTFDFEFVRANGLSNRLLYAAGGLICVTFDLVRRAAHVEESLV